MTARDRTLLIALAAVATVAAFWFVGLKPKRAEIASLDSQIVTQTERLQTARRTVAAGVAAKADYPRDHATVLELGKALPADDDLPSLLYELDAASRGAHIDFESIKRGAAAGSPAPTSATAPTGTAATSAAALPPGAVVGTAGLATLPFTFTFRGSFFDLQHFLASVDGFVRSSDAGVAVRGRLLTVNGVSLVPNEAGLARIEANIAATAYIAPQTGSTSAPTPGTGIDAGSGTTQAATTSAITGGSK